MKVKYTAKNFEVPTEGLHGAELMEIKELGVVETPNGEREKVRFTYELDETDSRGGRPLLVFQTFNLTLHPQSFLSKAITAASRTANFTLTSPPSSSPKRRRRKQRKNG